jgi:hypothetical protein
MKNILGELASREYDMNKLFRYATGGEIDNDNITKDTIRYAIDPSALNCSDKVWDSLVQVVIE